MLGLWAGPQAEAVERIATLSQRGLDVVTFWRECTSVLSGALAFDWYPCWFTLDPTSLLITSHFNEDVEVLDPAVFRNEYVDDDVNKIADLAASAVPVSTFLRGNLRGPRAQSSLSRPAHPFGIDQELVGALRADNQCWAAVALYREPSGRDLSPPICGSSASWRLTSPLEPDEGCSWVRPTRRKGPTRRDWSLLMGEESWSR